MIGIYDWLMRKVTLIFPISSDPIPRVLLGLKKMVLAQGKSLAGESPA
jgi:hypothetical protein